MKKELVFSRTANILKNGKMHNFLEYSPVITDIKYYVDVEKSIKPEIIKSVKTATLARNRNCFNFVIDVNSLILDGLSVAQSCTKMIKVLIKTLYKEILPAPEYKNASRLKLEVPVSSKYKRLERILKKLYKWSKYSCAKFFLMYVFLLYLLFLAETVNAKESNIFSLTGEMLTHSQEPLLSRMVKKCLKGDFSDAFKFGKAAAILTVVRALLQVFGLSGKESLRAVVCVMAVSLVAMKRGHLNNLRRLLFSDLFEPDIDYKRIAFRKAMKAVWGLIADDIVRFVKKGQMTVFIDKGNGNYRYLDPKSKLSKSDLVNLARAIMLEGGFDMSQFQEEFEMGKSAFEMSQAGIEPAKVL